MTDHPSPRIESRTWALAHDLNNFLTAIIGGAESILERLWIDQETRVDITNIREGARRAGALIRDASPIPRETSLRNVISLNETILATSRLLAFRLGSDIALTLDLTEAGDGVRAEPSQLDRILLNLVANARYAIDGSGAVTLRTERRLLTAASPCVPDTIPPADYVVIVVADTGSGIARDQLRRVFEPGVSSRIASGGSGLGLASVRDIVRGLNGFLAIESVVGGGTSVAIFLPRHARETRCSRVTEARSPSRAGVVLLVDDDSLVRQLTEQILRRAGWSVLCAGSAEAALEVSRHSTYDLLITDVAMQGMDGVMLTRQMLARLPELPVILTSGYAEIGMVHDLRSANVRFLTKPYGRVDLLEIIRVVTQRTAANPSETR